MNSIAVFAQIADEKKPDTRPGLIFRNWNLHVSDFDASIALVGRITAGAISWAFFTVAHCFDLVA